MFLPDYVLKAVDILNKNGYKAYPVGGCVRNHLMGILPDDYDMTTNATPEEMLVAFKGYSSFDAGLKHGTLSVIIDSQVIEITTHRIESTYTDNRHPDGVIFTRQLELDLGRRDFTMNAIAYEPMTKAYHDPYMGIGDIRNSLIRSVGDAKARFEEDALRILRALRFSSVLGFSIEQKTSDAIHSCKHLLEKISPERIYTEFTKLICGSNAASVLREYSDVIEVFIPEIRPMIGFDQHNIHHCYDVYEHTLATLDAIEPEPLLRWTMLLHDIGKPETFFTDERGGHFYGHYKNSTDIAVRVLTRLRASNNTIDRVKTLIYHHDSVIPESTKSVRRLISKLGYDTLTDLFKVNRADAKGQAPHQLKERIEHIDRLENIAEELMQGVECFDIKHMMIKGNDLISLGIPKGKRIGKILAILFDELTEEKLTNTKEALMKRALELKDTDI
ncbi:MAG: CCA tRNA nucleotidyltransferase [Clostridia bacterium]|nr:CCA tRNA nucleotidyltransferase [Clostridia bacterium]